MLNLVSFWRAMKLLSRMQEAENREQPGSDGRAGPALPDSDDSVARGSTVTSFVTRSGRELRLRVRQREGVAPGRRSPIGKWKVEVVHNLVHNRRLIVDLVVAILVTTAIVLLVAYSGGGSSGGIY